MAKENKGKRVGNITKEIQNGETESTKDTFALQNEIAKLKEKITEQDEIMDDLVAERDELSDEIYEVRLILADAWNIKRNTKPEKIWEVLRREREIKEMQSEKKKYSEVAKSNECILPANALEDGKPPIAYESLNETDSGFVNARSLTQLIDERVDVKLKNLMKTDTGIDQIEQSSSKELLPAIFSQTSRTISDKN